MVQTDDGRLIGSWMVDRGRHIEREGKSIVEDGQARPRCSPWATVLAGQWDPHIAWCGEKYLER